MTTFNIPWKCLDLSNDPKITTIEPPKPQKTFAQALTNLCDIPLSQFQQPVIKGDHLAIEIPEAAYEAGIEACKHNLHGRILWPKGSTPLSVVALKAKLAFIWKDLSRWGVISLGKGYFEFIPSWNLNPGLLRLFAWTKYFNPKMQQNTSVQVWVKIFGLSQEYWHKSILFTIAGSIGTPIYIDSVTAKPMIERTFGQFVRVLVDIDLLQPLRYKLLVERKGFAFFVDFEYEHIPDFCNDCKMIGQSFENCKRWNKEEEIRNNKESTIKKKVTNEPTQIFVPTRDGRIQQSKPKEVINVEKEVINVQDTSSKSPQVISGGINKEQGSSSKKHVSSPVEQFDVGLADAAILCPVSPKSILREQDKKFEQDLNTNLIDEKTSSQDSFVDATQVDGQIVMAQQLQPLNVEHSHLEGDACKLPTPERVAQDMAFLKESWANMADAEDEALKLLEDTGQGLDDDGFQI
jgi:hypothetical protein